MRPSCQAIISWNMWRRQQECMSKWREEINHRKIDVLRLRSIDWGSPLSGKRSPLLIHSPSCMIKFCIAKAAECRRAADAATDDPSRRQIWLTMEGEWFYLARSYDNERRGPSVGPCHE